MNTFVRWSGLSILILLLAFPLFAQDLPTLQVESYELPNGLNVILQEDHSLPTVAVNVWYHVGSKNEQAGRTGFAHLFEHLMFSGSEHQPDIYDVPIQRIGAQNNGSTSEDRTNYYEILPSNYLDLALWLESDRMGYLLPAVDQSKLDIQRDVVKNERRQRIDNQPYMKEYEIMLEMMYPPAHPYHHSVIGSMDDLSAASLEDVQNFFKLYYAPNNASIAVSGDFNAADAKAMFEKYFEEIPPSQPIERLAPFVPTLDREYRSVVEDNVTLPLLTIDWHTPGFYMPGDAEFDLLATILTSGKTSRLYKALVYDRQIAQSVSASQNSNQLSSTFEIQVYGKPGSDLGEIEKVVNDVLADVLENGVTQEELDRARVGWQANFVRQLQNNNGRANQMNSYLFYLGKPDMFQWDYNRYANATVESVMDAAKTYITDKKGVVLVVPQGSLGDTGETIEKNAQEMAPLTYKSPEAADKFADYQPPATLADRSMLPEGAAEPTFTPPSIQQATLKNGAKVLLVEDHRLPLIQANLVLLSGWTADPSDKPGTAAMTAALLDEGTKTRNALQISDDIKAIGAQLSTASSFDNSLVQLNTLTGQFDAGLGLMADMVLHPTFPDADLERIRKEYLGRIESEKRKPLPTAIKTMNRTLMGADNPYGQPYTGSGTEESIQAISRKDLVKFHKSQYKPNNAAFVIAGDITLDQAVDKLNGAFGKWKKGKVKKAPVPAPVAPEKTTIYVVDKPDAAQSAIAIGNLAYTENSPDALIGGILNGPLGGEFMSRINMNLREEKAWTYGAHSLFWSFRDAGAFLAYSEVVSDVTPDAVAEFFKEFNNVRVDKPLSDQEIADSRSTMTKRFPQHFGNLTAIANQLADLYTNDLPLDDWQTYAARVQNATDDQVQQVAQKYIQPDKMVVVVVGDSAKIVPGLEALGLGDVKVIKQ